MAWHSLGDRGKAKASQAALRVLMPMYRSLHADPRWAPLRDSLGISAARLDAIEFDPVMPD